MKKATWTNLGGLVSDLRLRLGGGFDFNFQSSEFAVVKIGIGILEYAIPIISFEPSQPVVSHDLDLLCLVIFPGLNPIPARYALR